MVFVALTTVMGFFLILEQILALLDVLQCRKLFEDILFTSSNCCRCTLINTNWCRFVRLLFCRLGKFLPLRFVGFVARFDNDLDFPWLLRILVEIDFSQLFTDFWYNSTDLLVDILRSIKKLRVFYIEFVLPLCSYFGFYQCCKIDVFPRKYSNSGRLKLWGMFRIHWFAMSEGYNCVSGLVFWFVGFVIWFSSGRFDPLGREDVTIVDVVGVVVNSELKLNFSPCSGNWSSSPEWTTPGIKSSVEIPSSLIWSEIIETFEGRPVICRQFVRWVVVFLVDKQ